MAETLRLTLTKPLERTLASGHPWIYRDAVDARSLEAIDAVAPGATVTVCGRKGRFLARGFSDAGPIAVRVVTNRDEPLGPHLWARRVARAAELRGAVVPPQTTAYRLVHGEGDRLPGCVADVYGALAVLRLYGSGVLAHAGALEAALWPRLEALGVDTLLLRTGGRHEVTVRALRGVAPDAPRAVLEHGMTLLVDPVHGQKTGLFLDHRESRRRVRALSRDRRVLNLYAYTGGFSVAAGLGGAAHVTSVDVAPAAMTLAEATWAANGLPADAHRAVSMDVPAFLAAERERRYDLIVADPPSFAPSADAVDAALESYRRLHAACLRALVPGGLYLAASCSSHVSAAAFDETLCDGARRAGRVTQILERHGAPADHPRLSGFPEGDYLKVALTRLID